MLLKQCLMNYVGLGVHRFFKNLGATSETLDAQRVTCSKFHTKDLQIIGATIQNLGTMVTRHPGFVHPSVSFCTCCHRWAVYGMRSKCMPQDSGLGSIWNCYWRPGFHSVWKLLPCSDILLCSMQYRLVGLCCTDIGQSGGLMSGAFI